jgi:hypothetical protein
MTNEPVGAIGTYERRIFYDRDASNTLSRNGV